MAEEKNDCGCGCNIQLKQKGEKPADDKKKVKESK